MLGLPCFAANASLRQEALDGVTGAAPHTLSIRPSSRPSVAAAPAAAAASAAPDKPLVRDMAADELQRQARVAFDRDPKGSGGYLGRDSSPGENDRSEDRTDEGQALVSHTSSSMVSEASAAADDPKIHKRGRGIGRVLRRFKEWLMSGLDEEEDAEVDGAWRLTPMDLDGFE